MSNLKIGIVDDHELFRFGVKKLIETREDLNVIWEAGNGKEMISKLKNNEFPELILMDINMPIMDGFESVHWLKKEFPQIKIIVLTMFDDAERVLGMIKLGVKGFLLKSVSKDDFFSAITHVGSGDVFFPTFVTQYLIKQFNDSEQHLKLNSREIEFIKLAATELTYKEISDKMMTSARTVEGYREQLFEKLGIKSRVGLVIYAIKNGLIGE